MPPRAPGAGPSSFPLGPLTGGVGGLPLPTWPPLTATGARGPGDRAGQRGTRRPLGCDMGGLHLGPHVIATGPARPSGSSRPGGPKSSIPWPPLGPRRWGLGTSPWPGAHSLGPLRAGRVQGHVAWPGHGGHCVEGRRPARRRCSVLCPGRVDVCHGHSGQRALHLPVGTGVQGKLTWPSSAQLRDSSLHLTPSRPLCLPGPVRGPLFPRGRRREGGLHPTESRGPPPARPQAPGGEKSRLCHSRSLPGTQDTQRVLNKCSLCNLKGASVVPLASFSSCFLLFKIRM